jgi:hypothetical protein
MDIANFTGLRPRLYHLTARANLPRIQRTARLDTAATILAAAARYDLLRTRRPESKVVAIDVERIHLRDQGPLYEGNCNLPGAFTFADLVEMLNNFVYFWPGTDAGPIVYGLRHFARYAPREDVVVLVIPAAALLAANPDCPPHFCKYNSGSPRSNPTSGKPPRGPDTFIPAAHFNLPPSRVIEVVFPQSVRLPLESVEVSPATRWLPDA